MEKKISDISEAFQQLKFTEALSLIDQTLKKNAKQDKKQKQLTSIQLRIIQSFKTGSLISLGRHHEASTVYQQLIQPQGILIMGKENPLLFLSISELFGQNKEKELIELLEKHSPNFDNSKIQRFYLSLRMFSTLSKLYLKDFMATKNNMLQLGQVYLEYLQNVNKLNLIQYQRDGWYKYHPSLKTSLKLVNMFLEKCLKNTEESSKVQANQNNKKVLLKGNELKLKIAINQGRLHDAIKVYHFIRDSLKLPFTYIRSIVKLKDITEEKDVIDRFYILEMQNIFKTNLNFTTYTPLYDYYEEFFQFLRIQAEKQSNNTKQVVHLSQNPLPFDELYNFGTLSLVDTLQKYYNSLFSEYLYLTDVNHPAYAQNKKSDYYKMCIKGLLLQLIRISNYLGQQPTTIKYLKEYTHYFSSTLTYSLQTQEYWKILALHQIIRQPEEVSNDSQLIAEINFIKISLSVNSTHIQSREELDKVYEKLMSLYKLRVKQIQKNRKLEKGQRYISDEFVVILADYIRAYIENEVQNSSIEQIIAKIINDLEYCVEVSSFNADLKLRLMFFLSYLNHHERLIEVYISNDIKSVQMQTLGYWFLKVALEFGTESTYEYFVERMIRSYHENQRETSEYGNKALKAGQLDRVEEYLSYRNTISNSYNSVVIYFMLFQKYRFESNCQYYLARINERINRFTNGEKVLTFNADFKVMRNVLFQDYSFGELYGLYNNYQIIQKEVHVYLHEQALINQLLERGSQVATEQIQPLNSIEEGVGAFEIRAIYDFSKYTFQEQRLQYNLQNSKKTLERNGILLNIFKSAMKVRVANIRLATLLVSSIKTQAINLQEVNSLEKNILSNLQQIREFHINIDYRSQIRSLVTLRRNLYECYNLLNLIRETASKNKKLKGIKPQIEAATSKVLQDYYNTLLNLKWSERLHKQGGLISKRDESIERQLELDAKQVKRILSKYQNLYRQ